MTSLSEFNHIKIEFVPKEKDDHIEFDDITNKDNIGIISINRPNKLNAINLQTMREIYSALTLFELSKTKCVIIRGTKDYTKKPSFSTGADLSSPFEKGIKPNIPYHMTYSIKELHKFFDLIEAFPKPLIAAVDGYALGGGLELSLVCDIIIASKRSIFGFSEIIRGILPAGGGTQRMVRNIGLNRTIKMLYFGKRYSAEELHKFGFVNYVTDNNEFEEFILKKSRELAQKPIVPLMMMKKALKFGIQVPLKIGKHMEQLGFGIIPANPQLWEDFDMEN
ncbi:MAG: enoyl-CoA hydratase/isomerase family protein [Promethearchaeota archaeon]|nr:MAG: enoyl-CoA hydratase/isomerase family protein [Candidatus Lokiarchaeota archaeon]